MQRVSGSSQWSPPCIGFKEPNIYKEPCMYIPAIQTSKFSPPNPAFFPWVSSLNINILTSTFLRGAEPHLCFSFNVAQRCKLLLCIVDVPTEPWPQPQLEISWGLWGVVPRSYISSPQSFCCYDMKVLGLENMWNHGTMVFEKMGVSIRNSSYKGLEPPGTPISREIFFSALGRSEI